MCFSWFHFLQSFNETYSRRNCFQNVAQWFYWFPSLWRSNLSLIDASGYGSLPIIILFGFRTIKFFITFTSSLVLVVHCPGSIRCLIKMWLKYLEILDEVWYFMSCPFRLLYNLLPGTYYPWNWQCNKLLRYLMHKFLIDFSEIELRNMVCYFLCCFSEI